MGQILSSLLWVIGTVLVVGLFLFLRAFYLVGKLHKLQERGCNLDTFQPVTTMMKKVWIWDMRKFATEETFLDRL